MTGLVVALAVLLVGAACAVDRTARVLTAAVAICAALWAALAGLAYLIYQGVTA